MSGLDSFEQVGDYLFKCRHCGEEVPSGIVNISGHWASCIGSGVIDDVKKIDGSNLRTDDKIDLLKNILNINQ